MSQNETEKLLAMLDSMEEAISTNGWPSNDPAGLAQIQTGAAAPATAPVGPWGQPAPSPQSPPWGGGGGGGQPAADPAAGWGQAATAADPAAWGQPAPAADPAASWGQP
ncbi:MAG TPA: hypothetical protein RMF84_10245, partial [Polyangiaceae bacterium LLY-WYZ-14_1]|nr:hypothetical protein [Polyangiaceae bacterium LLY-WYZ-14_1]